MGLACVVVGYSRADPHQDDEEPSHGLDVVGEGVEAEHLVEYCGHLGGAHEARPVLHQQLHSPNVPTEHLAVVMVVVVVVVAVALFRH